MSFVNLMSNDRWTEADILNRTEAMVRSEFSDQEQAILNRKATGRLLGQYTLSAEEQAQLARFAQVSESARQAGIEARADMALLSGAMAYEAAVARLARYRLADGMPAEPAVEAVEAVPAHMEDGVWVPEVPAVAARPEVPAIEPLPATVTITDMDGNTATGPNPVITVDDAERAQAQAVIDAATPEVLALVERRA